MSPSNKKGKIHLGDLAMALHKLGWENSENTKAIASCLGYDLKQMPQQKHQKEIADPRLPKQNTSTSTKQKPLTGLSLPPAPDLPPPMPSVRSFSELTRVDQPAASANENSRWQTAATTLFEQEKLTGMARQSLFTNRCSRHLFSAVLGKNRYAGEIDIPALIERVCTEQVILELPHTIETTLESGCHLLRDFSQTMVPWWDDLIALTKQVAEVTGVSRLQAYSFDTLPDKSMRWTTDGNRKPWQADGRPVLVATDFGIQEKSIVRDIPAEWHAFSEQCEQTASPLIILTPWPLQYCPKNLGTFPVLMHWSPHTTVAMIKKSIEQRCAE